MKKKSFWQVIAEGFATIGEGFYYLFDLGISREMPPNCREILLKTDNQAIREDWEKIGEAFRTTMTNQKHKADK